MSNDLPFWWFEEHNASDRPPPCLHWAWLQPWPVGSANRSQLTWHHCSRSPLEVLGHYMSLHVITCHYMSLHVIAIVMVIPASLVRHSHGFPNSCGMFVPPLSGGWPSLLGTINHVLTMGNFGAETQRISNWAPARRFWVAAIAPPLAPPQWQSA